MSRGEHTHGLSRRLFWITLAIVAGLAPGYPAAGWASVGSVLQVFPASRVGGGSGYGDQRDADVYPAVAYDAVTHRYLAVWLSARNAASSGDGLDVYGVFLNTIGWPTGNEFRISASNSAARGSLPAVAAGSGEFAVVWTQRGSPCQVAAQRVAGLSPVGSNQVLPFGSDPIHSPSVVYNAARATYDVAFVDGDDYLPPTLFGAATNDCGSNSASTSRVRMAEFSFSGNAVNAGTPVDVSNVKSGAFRPRLAYSAGLDTLLAVWEDRRNAGAQAYQIDVYSQRLASNLDVAESNQPLATGGDYTSDDTSATWTPRPVAAASSTGFFAAWFVRTPVSSGVSWSAQGAFVPGSGAISTPITITQMNFAAAHPGNAPSGFLAAAYSPTADEYLFGMTSFLESIFGYLSFALVQRVSPAGQLIKLDGTLQSQVGVGRSIDYQLDDQLGIALGTVTGGTAGTADYVALYSKHAPNKPAGDLDIWDAQVASNRNIVLLPLISR